MLIIRIAWEIIKTFFREPMIYIFKCIFQKKWLNNAFANIALKSFTYCFVLSSGILLYIFWSVLFTEYDRGIWNPISVSESTPSPRYHHVALWTGNEMIIWGGRTCKGVYLNDGSFYNPTSKQWTRLPSKGAPSARARCAAVWTGQEMLIWGGVGENLTYFNDGYSYNFEQKEWNKLPDVDFQPRVTNCCWTGSHFIIFGGESSLNEDEGYGSYTYNTGMSYNPKTKEWKTISLWKNSKRHPDGNPFWADGKFIVWGGKVYHGNWINTGAYYNPNTDVWTELEKLNAPSGRQFSAQAYWDNKLFIFCGFANDRYFNDGKYYDFSKREWFDVTNCPLSPREITQSTFNENKLFIYGGKNEKWKETKEQGAIYDMSNDKWKLTMNSPNAPCKRVNASVVWTGSCYIVWGGTDYTKDFNTGACYTPEAYRN